MPGNFPGIAPAPLTTEPLGTQGELTAGPDELDPSNPDDERELIERGYLEPVEESVETVEGFDSFAEAPAPDFDPFRSDIDPEFRGSDAPELPPLF